jgi:hypothetical protein
MVLRYSGIGALPRAARAAGASDRGGDDLGMTARTSRLAQGERARGREGERARGRGSQPQNLAQVFFGAAQCASASWRSASKSAACSFVGGGNGRLRGRPAPSPLLPQPPLRILAIAVVCMITAVGSQGDLPCALPSALAEGDAGPAISEPHAACRRDQDGFLIPGSSFQ